MYPVSEAITEKIQDNHRKYYWTGCIIGSAKSGLEKGVDSVVSGDSNDSGDGGDSEDSGDSGGDGTSCACIDQSVVLVAGVTTIRPECGICI